MLRFLFAVMFAGLLVGSVEGTYSQRIDHRRPAAASGARSEMVGVAGTVVPQNEQFLILDSTEVKLDGQTCRYADVPPDAEITLLEVTADRRHILRVHFTRKGK